MHPARAAAVLEVVTVVLDAPEGYAAQAVDFQNELGAGGGGHDVDVGFFAHADAVAGRVQGLPFQVGMEREVVETAVGETVSVIWWVSVELLRPLKTGCESHFAFFILAMRLAFASVEIHL